MTTLLLLACAETSDGDSGDRRPGHDADADADSDSDSDGDSDSDADWTLAPWLGIDGNAPIADDGSIAAQLADPALVASSGAGWVRINFKLGPWSSPEDPAWIATYRAIVEPLVAEGLQVYGLIGAESISSNHALGSEGWIEDYSYNFVSIVGNFKDLVRVYESFNEPNNWDETSQPTLSPEEYALLLQEVYLEVKHHNGHIDDPDWQVTLVSGPLFTHDADTGAAYLDATYTHGRSALAWDWTHAETGSYPLDGVGAHLYVAQGETGAPAIERALETNLSALQAVIDAQDPGKRMWISEVGWSSDAVGEDGQAAALGHALDALRGDARLAMVSWFCIVDWTGVGWGLRSDVDTPKAAWARFQGEAGG